jgi:hypothetical protein
LTQAGAWTLDHRAQGCVDQARQRDARHGGSRIV